jgi:hypothetical protein
VDKIFFGSTAEKVVRTAGCPVLTVPLPKRNDDGKRVWQLRKNYVGMQIRGGLRVAQQDKHFCRMLKRSSSRLQRVKDLGVPSGVRRGLS